MGVTGVRGTWELQVREPELLHVPESLVLRAVDQRPLVARQLYLFMGDQGRRGWLQNLPHGPFLTAPQVDDTFGGPAPDNAHFTGVILRLNDDGTTPTDNPFFAFGAALGGEAGANIQKIFSYGHRNGFGMAFDPVSGSLWETENADD